jgi:hypothetical protein
MNHITEVRSKKTGKKTENKRGKEKNRLERRSKIRDEKFVLHVGVRLKEMAECLRYMNSHNHVGTVQI